MKKLKFIIVCFLFIIKLEAQKDSTLELNKVREVYNTGYTQGNPELVKSAAQTCKDLIAVYKRNGDRKNLARAYTLFGKIIVEKPSDASEYAEAKNALTEALDLSIKEFGPDADETLEAKKYLSWAYGYLGDADMELKYSEELRDSYKKNTKKYALEMAELYNTIGTNYGYRNNRPKERENLNDAIQLLEDYKPKNEEEGNSVQASLMSVFNSMSQSYINSIDYVNALTYARKSLQISNNISPNSPQSTPALVAVGRSIYALEKKCDSALYYLDNAIKILESNALTASHAWLSYRSYKVNLLARCGNGNAAISEARNTVKTLLAQGGSPEEALTQLIVLSQNTNAELLNMENEFRKKEEAVRAKQLKERLTIGGIFLILLAVGTIAFVRYKKRKKQQLSEDLHDQLGSNITHLTNFCAKGYSNLKKALPIEKSFVDVIAKETMILSENLKELRGMQDPQYKTLEGLLIKIRHFAINKFENSDVALNLNLPQLTKQIKTNYNNNRNIYLIVTEALNNISKHSNATSVSLSFVFENNLDFTLIISDNGAGFETKNGTTGSGLKNFKSRAKEIKNGKVTIDATVGKGTTIKLSGTIK